MTSLDQFEYMEGDSGGDYNPASPTLRIGQSATDVMFAMNQPLSTTLDGGHSCVLERDPVEGIEAVAAIVAHELMHKHLFGRVVVDQDKDGVRYEDEIGVMPWTYYEEPNTYGLTLNMFFNDAYLKKPSHKKDLEELKKQLLYNGDNELKAIMAEKNRIGKWDSKQDWAYPGSQSGK